MSSDLRIILDQESSPFSYEGTTMSPRWTSYGVMFRYYEDRIRIPFTETASFTFTFNGTSAAFIGFTQNSSAPQTATVQIDNGTSFLIDYGGPTPIAYKQWFTTPTLPDGEHTVTVSDLNQTAIDYAVVTVGKDTRLTGQTVIVDDDSPLIQYSGQWSRNTDMFLGGWPTGYPYGNVTHRSSNPGDSFTFRFSGRSIAVYGIFSWYNIGTLSVTYSIDGTPYPLSISVTSLDTGEASNYLYFCLDSLPSGIHTLLVNITAARNQSFILDYITYKPSFDTLSSMPSLALIPSLSSGIPAPSNSTASGSRQSGAIVGGVLGGLAFGGLVTVLVALFILHWRRARKHNYADQDLTPDPYTVNSVQTRGLNPANCSTKRANHERSNYATANPQNSNTAAVGNSTGVEDPLCDPPNYDIISNNHIGT